MKDGKKLAAQVTPKEIKKLTPYLDDLGLTIRQRAFAYYYVLFDFKRKEATKAAGYKVYNTKKSKEDLSFLAMGGRNLSRPNIKEAIKRVCDHSINDKPEVEKTLFNLIWKRATYDINTFVNSDGSFKFLDEIPHEWVCVIDETEVKYYGKDAQKRVVVSKLADREKSIERLDKFINFTKESPGVQINVLSDEAQINMLNLLHGKEIKE